MTDPKGYNILDPSSIKWAERDGFIQKLVGAHTPAQLEAEDAIVSIWDDICKAKPVQVKVDKATVELAQDYIRYRSKGARLPKFGRWATGMFKDNSQLAADLAAAGKYVEKSGDIVISGDIVDILRCADTKHFTSCFSKDSCYPKMPQHICEDAPGICIAYVDDNGTPPKMRGRVWVHHAERVEDGVEVAVVCKEWAGSLSARQVAEHIQKTLDIPAYIGGSYGRDDPNGVPVNFINCFDKSLHHDLYTWVKGFRATPI